MLVHLLIAVLLSLAIAGAALASKALTRSGAMAATAVGSLAFAAGSIGWSLLLLLFFLSSSALARLPSVYTAAVARIVDRHGPRNWAQVLANGGVPALCSLGQMTHEHAAWGLAYTASQAAATADTWATETGSRSSGPPRSITGRQPATHGESGAVTGLGILAAAIAATVLALAGTLVLHVGPVNTCLIALIGFSGSLIDSVLGATVQEKRLCAHCATRTEQRVHIVCGSTTQRIHGYRGMTNDTVNATMSFVVGVVALCAGTVLNSTS